MKKHAMLLYLSIFSISASAADMVLKRWVREATQIKIEALKNTIIVSINSSSTFGDVKNTLSSDEDIHVEYHVLKPIWLYQEGVKGTGPEVGNSDNVKRVMSEYNTSNFKLFPNLIRINKLK